MPLLKQMTIFLNNQFPLNFFKGDVYISKNEIMDFFLSNSVPMILYVFNQCIGILLSAYDLTLLYIKEIHISHLSSLFS